jgi:hypothetical protein
MSYNPFVHTRRMPDVYAQSGGGVPEKHFRSSSPQETEHPKDARGSAGEFLRSFSGTQPG